MSVYMVDKHLYKICHFMKDTLAIISLTFLGIKAERIIKVIRFFIWDILLTTPEVCMATAS